jgi:putative OPT family oligopeptide transporter
MKIEDSTAESYKPFIPAEKLLPELSVFSVGCGVALAIVFGGANAYLGLRVGMTISASIPAAVISMGIMRVILKRESILENNMAQTIGSAGESLAAGAIFTIPALFLWYSEWGLGTPGYILITSIALAGGILGVALMIPLRRALIVKEHGVLPYPEGTACASVLKAGEQGGSKAKLTFIGLGLSAVYKFLSDGFKLFASEADWSLPSFKGSGFGIDALPALLGVGFIVGIRISSYLLAGAFLGWFVAMPIISYFGSLAPNAIYPAAVPIAELNHWGLWSNYIRYIGAGAVAFGGIYSLIRSLPLIVSTFKKSIAHYKNQSNGEFPNIRTDRDISMRVVIAAIILIILVMGLTPLIPVGLPGAALIAIFGFFFATVASRIVGIVGSSNSPVSGITIGTLIITAFFFKLIGNDGVPGIIATISVGGVICITAAISGDTSQDLKTGYLLGATPLKQQIGELIGVAAAALTVAGILILLNNAWGFGSSEIPAPQATLMKLVVEGVMGGNLPWPLVFSGAALGLVLAVFRLPVLPVAIGLYLPIHLSTPIIIGGFIRYAMERRLKRGDSAADAEIGIERGVLFSSGLIAGEGLIGILLAVFAVTGINLSNSGEPIFGRIVSCGAFAFLCLCLVMAVLNKKNGCLR